MKTLASILSILLIVVLTPLTATAGPADDANAVVDRWSAAYNSNDPEAMVAVYWPDATLLGTTSPVMSEGTEALRTYFSVLKGSDLKSEIGDRRTITVSDNAVVVAGFYRFSRNVDGKPIVSAPSRFTMLIVRRDGGWKITHHHSSPHVQPKQQ
jgi:uncharacterized protein (TIGR02246 family)